MVSLEIDKNDLKKLIGKDLTDQQIEETLFLLKCEAQMSGNTIKCEINPDRPDMFSPEGLAREIKGFLGIETGLKNYKITDSHVALSREKADVRPHIVCAILKDIRLSDEMVKSLMQIQEKLHDSIGRNRKKVAIGVHDFDKIKPPLVYKDVDDVKFVPLGEKEMSVKEILENHPKGKEFAHLVKDKFPMISDKEGVISFPPIINSERTKVTQTTKNLFIDVTGTDERAVNQVLNILVCNIAERGGEIQRVKVSNKSTPDLEPKEMELEIQNIDSFLGLGLNEKQIEDVLKRMHYGVSKVREGKITVLIPAYRTDILHIVDIIEDIAIGFGYNNIQPILPKLATIGGLSNIEKLTTKTRDVMMGLGFQETLNFILTNEENNFKKMKTTGKAVEILNPTSSEYNICRTWILPSLLKVLSANQHRDFPQKIFEIGDIIEIDEKAETKTKTIRKISCIACHDNANLTEIKSVMENVLKNLGIKYQIGELTNPSFIDTRAGQVMVNNIPVGFFAEIHPEILTNWKLERPVVVFEMNLI